MMRVAALYDMHANQPALEAVLEDIREANVDPMVVGSDVVPGPMPRETLRCLLDLPVHFIHGNGELALRAQLAAEDEGSVREALPRTVPPGLSLDGAAAFP